MSGVGDLAAFLSGASSPESGGDPNALVEVAFVTAVIAGAAKGGQPLVKVFWRGANVSAAHLRSYSNPAVGDLVLLTHCANVPYILGPLDGLPV